ncbi:tRNA pseudouridine(38-40) synthase TruA [Nocardioides marmoribigeumensis]|uniref:tRNA pseudouridine synthase A n=1 Tax=Nocardioides marmoribigeumensis TaxID=433649 RepID=A0ABU2BZL5_9ACTN|nr:tRNA pseudouridine(38-40) synthase TruA [Nocardioides marmoribigeumensis]MDR7363846.1 tRNA pseudouridine38-40 synthase [Nocardioides marmoribigeumensis]
MRVRLDLSYDGGGFHGWAAQPGLRTVQGDLQDALRTVLREPDLTVTCAGRTDTGVHARGQVVHADVAEESLAATVGRSGDAPVDALARRLNGVLACDVRVRRVSVAPEGFDARFSALWRRYVYRLSDAPGVPDPLTRGHVLVWPRPLDESAMQEAAAGLLGEHDFAAFCKRREGATTVRRLLDLRVERVRREGGSGLDLTVRADAFCHSMVRALTGCLLAVGEGRRDPSWAAEVLAGRQRDPAVLVVPPHGLCLEEVAYPADEGLAARVEQSRRVRTLAETEAVQP